MSFSSLITLTGPINRMQTVNLLNIYLPQIILDSLGPKKYHNKTSVLHSMHSEAIPCLKLKFSLILLCTVGPSPCFWTRLFVLLNTCTCLSQFITCCKWFTKLFWKYFGSFFLTNEKPAHQPRDQMLLCHGWKDSFLFQNLSNYLNMVK